MGDKNSARGHVTSRLTLAEPSEPVDGISHDRRADRPQEPPRLAAIARKGFAIPAVPAMIPTKSGMNPDISHV